MAYELAEVEVAVTEKARGGHGRLGSGPGRQAGPGAEDACGGRVGAGGPEALDGAGGLGGAAHGREPGGGGDPVQLSEKGGGGLPRGGIRNIGVHRGAVGPEGHQAAVEVGGRGAQRRQEDLGEVGGGPETEGELPEVRTRGMRLGDRATVPHDRPVLPLGQHGVRMPTPSSSRMSRTPDCGGQGGQYVDGHGAPWAVQHSPQSVRTRRELRSFTRDHSNRQLRNHDGEHHVRESGAG